MIKKVNLIRGDLSSFAFMAVIFFMPISRKLYIISLWLWGISWIVDGSFQKKFSKKKYLAAFPTLIGLSGIYFMSLISLIWSENISRGIEILTTQAGLLLIPFLFSFSNRTNPNFNYRNAFLRAFLAGLIIVSCYLLAISFKESVSLVQGKVVFDPKIGRWENVFLHERFSFIIHPSYFGMMILMGIAIVLIDLKEKNILPYSNIIAISLLLFLLVILFLSSTRASVIGLILISLFNFRSLKIPTPYKIVIYILIMTLIGVYIVTNPRFINPVKETLKTEQPLNLKELNRFNIRYDIWSASFEIIKKSPVLGTGLGDTQNKLNQEYLERGNALVDKLNYNCHNQFIETQVSTGIIGLIILMAILFSPLIFQQYWRKEFYLNFLIIVLCGFMFESILNRVTGIAFFSIFYTLFTHSDPD